MGKIWLKGPSPDGQCCGCEGRTSPCDGCGCVFVPFDDTLPSEGLTLTQAEQYMRDYVMGCKTYFWPTLNPGFEKLSFTQEGVGFSLEWLQSGQVSSPSIIFSTGFYVKASLTENSVITFQNTNNATSGFVIVYDMSENIIMQNLTIDFVQSDEYQITLPAGNYVLLLGIRIFFSLSPPFPQVVTAYYGARLSITSGDGSFCNVELPYSDGLEEKRLICEV